MGNLAPGNVRLTKYHREAIAKKVLAYKFQNSTNQLKSIETEHKNLAQAVYDAVFSVSEREKMDALPKGWMYEDDDIKCQFGGVVGSLSFSGTLFGIRGSHYHTLSQMGYAVPEQINKRLPYDRHYSVLKVFDHNHPLTERHSALTRRFSTMMEEATKSKHVLEAALKNASTSNALIKAWPEVEPFVKQVLGNRVTASTALSVPVAQLNETFGLPVPA